MADRDATSDRSDALQGRTAHPERPLRLGRPFVFAGLFAVFLLCFLLTPLWNSFPGWPLKACALAATAAAGFAWAWLGSGPLQIGPAARWAGLPLCVLALALADRRALAASIPWRGDEDYYVAVTGGLAAGLGRHPACLLAFAAFLAFAATRRSWDRAMAAASALFALGLAWAARRVHIDPYDALRSPIFPKYLEALPVRLWEALPGRSHPEAAYRLLSLLSAGGLVWLTFRASRGRPPALRMLACLAIAGLPLIRYYDSLFYLEMPALLAVALACADAETLLAADPERAASSPGWIGLLLLGFMKETTAPFLAAFLLCRAWTRLAPCVRDPRRIRARALGEARVAFCLCLPLALYLFYRKRLGEPRPYLPDFGNLADPDLLRTQWRSWWDSFGLFPLLALAGAAAAWRAGRRRRPAFLLAALGTDALFHFLDFRAYIGLSRYNLLLLPPLLALAWEAVNAFGDRFRPATGAGLAAILIVDLVLSPYHADGSRKAGWGVYGTDVGEHDYPYREALERLAAEYGNGRTLLAGAYYPYRTGFYLGKPDWPEQTLLPESAALDPPAAEAARMDSLLEASYRAGYAAVLYHVLGPVPAAPDPGPYRKIEVFRNQAHGLILFGR